MEHFEKILALSRMALNGDTKRVENQIKKLRDAVQQTDPDQAKKLTRLISRQKEKQEVAPMSLERTRASANIQSYLPGESMSKSTPVPVDKETGAPLARVIFPQDRIVNEPILSEDLTGAIRDLLNEWENVEALAEIGVEPNTRCLIYGPPGVGKSQLAMHISKSLNLPMVEARLDGLVSSFLGTSARNIGALFDFANRYKCILFLDEFDAIAKARDDSQEIGEIKRVVNTLLQSLDSRGSNGFTLAATNHEHLLDQAVWRRFQARIRIGLPDVGTRTKILTQYLHPIKPSKQEMKLLEWLTDGMSGADIETLVTGGKRHLILNKSSRYLKSKPSKNRRRALYEAIKRQAIVNSGLFNERVYDLLTGPKEEFLNIITIEAGLTQSQAAELVGISQSTVSRKLKGQDSEA